MDALRLSDAQKTMCEKYATEPYGVESAKKIGIALHTLQQEPLHGMRIQEDPTTTGWYIWGGEYDDDPDFFQPLCAEHMNAYCPDVIPYLALKPGYRFVIDRQGYEDVWFDAQLLS